MASLGGGRVNHLLLYLLYGYEWGLPLRLAEEIATETRKAGAGAGAGTTTGSDLRSRGDIEDRTLRRTQSVRVFAFLRFGGHGMGYRDRGRGGGDDGDGHGNDGRNVLRGGGPEAEDADANDYRFPSSRGGP